MYATTTPGEISCFCPQIQEVPHRPVSAAVGPGAGKSVKFLPSFWICPILASYLILPCWYGTSRRVNRIKIFYLKTKMHLILTIYMCTNNIRVTQIKEKF